jgi:uncharacterized protein (DUF2141 family)
MKLSTLFTTTMLSASLSIAAFSSIANAAQLDVTFKHVEKSEGYLLVALYNSPGSYNGEAKPVQVVRVPATSEKVNHIFEELENGTYAIKLYHDANNNGEMDTNMFGIPKEGYGFSNNVGRFGEPSFAKAAFNVDSDSAIVIIVR